MKYHSLLSYVVSISCAKLDFTLLIIKTVEKRGIQRFLTYCFLDTRGEKRKEIENISQKSNQFIILPQK